MQLLLVLFFTTFFPVAAHAVCDAGYYLENDECKVCNPDAEPFFCPGDDTRHPCPTTDTDYEKLSGWKFLYGRETNWALKNASYAEACHSGLHFQDSYGNSVLIECAFNGENYWCDRRLWFEAGPGFYLADYDFTSVFPWYSSVHECTNAPANAHYTGPGTPDAPNGSATDANDCPWACDDGYGRVDNSCVPLCDAGISHLRVGNLALPLFPRTYSSPTLAVGIGGRVCYGVLYPGRTTGAINININGTIYHVEN